jgi:hypothetical protein
MTTDTTTEENFDPFDIAALRANPPVVGATESVMLGITVRKPKKDEFFRVNPDPEMTVDAFILEFEGGNDRKADYFVPPFPGVQAACEQAGGQAFKAVRLVVCMNKWGSMFVWAPRLPDDRQQKWHTTALLGMEAAKTHWVRLQADMRASMYKMDRAVADMGEPQWPEGDLGSILKLAFGADYTITSIDHPVLRELRGEV